jgi:hypothetical protein
MPTKFPSEAANSDFLGEEPDDKHDTSDAPPIGADGTPRGRADGTPEPAEHRRGEAERQQGRSDDKPGTKKDSAEP